MIANQLIFAQEGRAPGGARFLLRVLLAALFALILAQAATYAQSERPRQASEQAPLVIEGESASDVFGLGRTVIVRGVVRHGVVAFGGDVIVEGRIEGDAAAIGGSVIQRDGSFIGGDVIVLGGAYHHGANAPGRKPESATIMVAGYEAELREMARNPLSIIEPRWSAAFFGQRVLAVLFWFIFSLALTASAPGAISHAGMRLRLTSLRVALIGFLSALVIAFGMPVSLRFLPTTIGTLVFVTALLLLVLAYLFGRAAIHAATGRWLQQKLFPEGRRSESAALLLGTSFWTILLSLPYVWPLVVAGLLVTSLGLALTAQYRSGWRRPLDA